MPSPLCFGACAASFGAAPPSPPGPRRGPAQSVRPRSGPRLLRDMAGSAAAPPAPSPPGSSPAPAAAPPAACSSRALGQRRQLPEPETMLLRHPHAVPSNALQREDGRRERRSEPRGQSRSAAAPGGAGSAAAPRGLAQGPRRRGPPPPAATATGGTGRPPPGWAGPGRAGAPLVDNPPPGALLLSPPGRFCASRAGGAPGESSPKRGAVPASRPPTPRRAAAKFGSCWSPKGTADLAARGGRAPAGCSEVPPRQPQQSPPLRSSPPRLKWRKLLRKVSPRKHRSHTSLSPASTSGSHPSRPQTAQGTSCAWT